MDVHDISRAATGFFDFVKGILPEDKFTMFKSLVKYPLSTVTLTEEIYMALEKMFDGRNPVFKYEFLSEEHRDDWEEYRVQMLKEPTVWKTLGFEIMKTAINSIVVVDMPEEQGESERPEPYFFFLRINDVVDFECGEDGDVLEWVMFSLPNDRLAVYCDGFYRIFQVKEGTIRDIIGEPLVESEHDLGYCPARFFWTTPVSLKTKIVKKSPLSNQLGKLDMLLFFDVANEHLNVYGRYPIYSGFASDCGYEDNSSGEYCDGGYLRTREGEWLRKDDKLSGCPICERKRLDGPGSFIEIDPPNQMNGNADLRNPVQITSIDRTSLDYNNEDIARRRLEIYAGVTGYKGLPINDQAVNEKQVLAIFESLEAALKSPQMNFENIMQWVDETVCMLRYGRESFVSASISLGTEHFIIGAAEIMELYDKAKKSSFSVGTLDMLEDLYYETEYRNNPEQLQRQRILLNLDPFRHMTIQQVEAMYQGGRVRYEDYMLKVNFSSLIMRFERENMSVVEFGSALDFSTKIANIKAALEVYIGEMKPEEVMNPNPDDEGGGQE